MKYTREGHYQIACKVYFDATHSGADDQDVHINHPNQYFDESQLFYSGKKEGRLQICNSGQMYLELWIQNALGKTSICYNYALESQDPKPHLKYFLTGKIPNTPARTGSQRSSQSTQMSQASQNSQPVSQNATMDDEMMDDDLCMAAMETA